MYEKTTWTAGDKITAEKLNKIENALDQLLNGTASDSIEGDLDNPGKNNLDN